MEERILVESFLAASASKSNSRTGISIAILNNVSCPNLEISGRSSILPLVKESNNKEDE